MKLLLMLQFFTRIPIDKRMNINETVFGEAILYLPVVGVIIGCINVVCYSFFLWLLPSQVAAIMVILCNTCLTGAFHVDGLADTCDGIFSGRNKERVLEIMKDSRIGTNGACAIVFDFMIRAVCLAQMSGGYVMLALVLAPLISRTMITILMHSPYARSNKGLGSLFINRVTIKNIFLTFLVCSFMVWLILYFGAGDKSLRIFFMVMGCNLALIFSYKKMILAQIGGMTGDTLGAGNEICEIMVLLIFISLEKWAVLNPICM